LNNNYIQKEFLNIILLNYNGSADTIECLNSILTSDYVNFEITIVDNNSTPNDILILNQYILHKYNNYYIYDYDSHVFNLTNKKVILKTEPRINLIKLNKNFGFANGNNIGIDFGRKPRDIVIIEKLISGATNRSRDTTRPDGSNTAK
jgi:GT2 family glycosyltransferase